MVVLGGIRLIDDNDDIDDAF